MNITILFSAIAAILFLLASFNVAAPVNLTALGLFFLTLAIAAPI